MGGFIFWTATNRYWWSTAGHCGGSGSGGWGSAGRTFQHPSGTNRGSVTYRGWYAGSVADVALFEISASQKSNILCRTTNCATSSITSRECGTCDVVGQTVFVQRRADFGSATLVHRNVSIAICNLDRTDCRQMHFQRETSIPISVGGDSGGPIFSPSLTKAIGMISASKTYTHISSIELQAAVQTQVTP
jgi:hypothetical protein